MLLAVVYGTLGIFLNPIYSLFPSHASQFMTHQMGLVRVIFFHGLGAHTHTFILFPPSYLRPVRPIFGHTNPPPSLPGRMAQLFVFFGEGGWVKNNPMVN